MTARAIKCLAAVVLLVPASIPVAVIPGYFLGRVVYTKIIFSGDVADMTAGDGLGIMFCWAVSAVVLFLVFNVGGWLWLRRWWRRRPGTTAT